MTATRRSADDDSQPTVAADSGAAESRASLLQTSVAATMCDSCGSGMAPDQRYCVECGTRRGRPRFELQAAGGTEPVVERPSGRRPSTMILLAGIVTVLLALGVGFLIGKSASKASSVHVVVTTAGGGAATSGSSGSGGSTSTGSSGSSGSNANRSGSGSNASSGSSTAPNGGNFFGGG
jgi:hypothetical protein